MKRPDKPESAYLRQYLEWILFPTCHLSMSGLNVREMQKQLRLKRVRDIITQNEPAFCTLCQLVVGLPLGGIHQPTF